MSTVRVDLHCHTRYSRDSLTSCDDLLRWMDRRGLDMVAITDHNTIAGALDFRARAPDRFLVGEEIKTPDGELIALFIEEEVPAGLSLQETAVQIHQQGGLVGASHPLDRWRGEAVGKEMLEAIRDHLDFLEVFNARVVFPSDNHRAQELADRWGLPGSAGSDAHAPFEVGRTCVEMPPFDGPCSFLEALARGRIGGRVSSPLVHFHTTFTQWRKRLGAH